MSLVQDAELGVFEGDGDDLAAVGVPDVGSAWLQATSTLEEYQGRAVRRVFEALAPVLLPGKVEQPVGRPPWEQLVMDVDAADYR